MSLILDALNKADDERQKNELPSLHSSHDSGEEVSQSKHQYKIMIGLGGAVCLLFALVIYLLFSRGNTPENDKRKPPQQVAQQTQVKAFEAPGIPSEPNAGNNTAQNNQENDDTYQRMKEKLIAAQYQNAQTQAQSTPKVQAKDAKVSQIYQTQTQASPKPKPVATAQPTPVPPPKVVIKTLEDFPTLSFIGELAYSIQKNIPTVMYTEHMYNAQGDIYVVLNNTKRRKGQQVADNLYLEEVLEDGIVLKHNNLRFKMIALNSWIRI